MSQRLIVLASYPKSGNTWARLVFQNLLSGHVVSLNQLSTDFYGYPRRVLFDDMAPVNSADLYPEEIDELAPAVFRRITEEVDGPLFVKLHDMARRTRSGEWLLPTDAVQSVIHLVRHPFDVAASYAAHLGLDADRIVDILGTDDETVSLPASRIPGPLHQVIGSWSQNVMSWFADAPYGVTTVRFEDMHADPLGSFGRIIAAAGFEVNDAQIARAVQASSFERLREEERKLGFRERPGTSSAFFRSGKPGSWDGLLSDAQRAKIAERHGDVMARFGYGADGSIGRAESKP